MTLALWTALRGLRARLGALTLTVLAVALATATALSVPLLTRQVERGAQDAAQIFDLLIAAPGSPTQAVLSSLFYLDAPSANLPAGLFEQLRDQPGTRRAVPIGLGDSLRGLPIVGTSAAFLEQRARPGDPPYFHLSAGQVFQRPFEAVLGARAARDTGLHVGDTFRSTHGLEPAPDDHEDHPQAYRVVGILGATGGPADRAVLTPIETLWATHPGAPHTVTAVLYSADTLAGVYVTAQTLRAAGTAMPVFPGQVFAQASDALQQGRAAYAALSTLVLGIAALTVWLGVHAAARDRAYTVALLRALGAGRGTIVSLILLETALTLLLGVGAGLLVTWATSTAGATLLQQHLGFRLAAPEFTWPLLRAALALIPLGLLIALPSAWTASRRSPLTTLNSGLG